MEAVDEVVSVRVSVLEGYELFYCSVVVCNVYGVDVGFLVKGKCGPEVVPSHPEGEAEGTVLDHLKFGDVSFCRQRKSEGAVGEKREDEGFEEVKFRFRATVAEALQVAQGCPRYGCFLSHVHVKPKVFVDV